VIWIIISLCTGGVRHLYYNNNCYTLQTAILTGARELSWDATGRHLSISERQTANEMLGVSQRQPRSTRTLRWNAWGWQWRYSV